MTFLTNGACAVRERIPVRMLLITPQIVNAFDMNVTCKPYSRMTCVNDAKFDAGPTSILNIGYASYSRGNFTPEKALRKRCAGRTYVSESVYLPNLHILRVNLRKRHLAASVNMQLRYNGVRDLRQSYLSQMSAYLAF